MSDKQSIRSETLRRRDAIPPQVRKVKDAAVRQRVLGLPGFQGARVVLLYASFRSEVDTMGLIEEALRSGKRVVLPRVEGRELKLYEVQGAEELAPGCMGIPEPPASGPRLRGLEDVDMVLLPGVAFDPSGWRIGYGKGYYDRLLDEARDLTLVGLAYEEQLVESVPHEEYDRRVHMVITDQRVIHCHGQRQD